MNSILDITTAREAVEEFSWDQLWELFDGSRERLNIAHECLDRHDPEAIAARIAFADGRIDEPTFGELSRSSSQFANWLESRGVGKGEAVGVMMEPSRAFYAAVFGVIKRGAVAVPLYTLFGPEAVRDRMEDCKAVLLIGDERREDVMSQVNTEHVILDADLADEIAQHPTEYEVTTESSDRAVLQYTSGTTRQLPEGVVHDHRSVVTLSRAALFALGLRRGDRYFCPSSPAWGHGLWHGTIAPWSLGIALGAYSGKFEINRLVDVLQQLRVTNLAAASTVYRMLLASERLGELQTLVKASYTGEELDAASQERFFEAVGIPVCGMYGTTETGVILVNFPGFSDHTPKPGALGKPMPGCQVAVLDSSSEPVGPDVSGEISIWRRGEWFRAKDLGWTDDDGYFYYGGRADDVIISSGWTISPLEVERTLMQHDAVLDAAVIGVPDETRGLAVKAYVVTQVEDPGSMTKELQDHVKRELSPHEYPRTIEYVESLPKTPNGKINRRALREGL